MPPLVLPPDEVKRRIHAARILRQMDQVTLDRRGHEDGLDKQELSRLERGELPMTKTRRSALCDILRVPERWFTAESIDEVVGVDPGAGVTVTNAGRDAPVTVKKSSASGDVRLVEHGPGYAIVESFRGLGLTDEQIRAATGELAQALLRVGQDVLQEPAGEREDRAGPGHPARGGAGGAG